MEENNILLEKYNEWLLNCGLSHNVKTAIEFSMIAIEAKTCIECGHVIDLVTRIHALKK